MIRALRENFLLKVISLATSIMIWQYVAMERTPAATRSLMAEVQVVGASPEKLYVEARATEVPVFVTGPKAEVESLEDGAVKAVVDLSTARQGTAFLRIVDYLKPPRATRISVRGQRQLVPAVIEPKQVKQNVPIEVSFNFQPPFGKSYSRPSSLPAAANVIGRREDLDRVLRLQVHAKPAAGNIRQEAPIYAVDREGVVLETVTIEPPQATISMNLVDAASTRSLVVSVRLRGRPAAPFVVAEAIVEPDQVTVEGKHADLFGLTHVSTAEVSVDGLRADLDRVVPIQLPQGVSVKGSQAAARVIVRVQDGSKPAP